ncbi:hypothetical protein ACS0TY_010300 [Phlomoides rotata]
MHHDERAHQRELWMRSLSHSPKCFKQLRVNIRTFNKLCGLLRNEGGLFASKHVTIQEIVALFLYILGHDQKNSTNTTMFVRSGETISRQFHTVLCAVLRIGKLFLKQQCDRTYNQRDVERWSWFPNAVVAFDGTFVDLKVPADVRSKYRNRKGCISTNIIGVCDANMRFLYVLPGWEGSASDARVLRDALQRPNGLNVTRRDSLPLNEWRGNTPRNYKELFSLRHSSARNAIERTFGFLKKRWAILRTMSFYDVKTKVRIINACCILHNVLELLELQVNGQHFEIVLLNKCLKSMKLDEMNMTSNIKKGVKVSDKAIVMNLSGGDTSSGHTEGTNTNNHVCHGIKRGSTFSKCFG